MAGISKVIEICLSITLATVFIHAGVTKLIHPDEFIKDILSYQLLPYQIAFVSAYSLPPLEILAGLSFLKSSWRIASAWLVLLMTSVFIAAITSAWIRGLDISCGCFGPSDEPANYLEIFLRDILIITIAVLIIWLTKKNAFQSNETNL